MIAGMTRRFLANPQIIADRSIMAPDNATRQKIIDAMYHLIAEYGYDKASLSKLCDVVDITKPSIYYYFQSKEDILLAVHDSMHIPTESDDDLCATTDADSYRRQLVALGERSIASFHDDAERHRVMAEIDLQSTRIPSLAEHRAAFAQKTSHSYHNALSHGVKLGALPETLDVDTAAQFLYVVMAGMSQTVANRDRHDENAIWSWLVNALLLNQKSGTSAAS